MAKHRVVMKKILKEEASMWDGFIDVLNKTCESKFIYTTEDHLKELEKHNYNLRRALAEFKQLIKEKATLDGRCSWLWRLELELKYSFIRLVPFLEKIMDVNHDDFVCTVHSAERLMDDYFKQMLKSSDKMIPNDFPCCLAYIARLLLREWAAAAETDGVKGAVIICPSSSSLSAITSKGVEKYGETGTGLKRWMDEKVFPLLSKKLIEDEGISAAENITVFIETEEQTGELSFKLESTRTTQD